MKSIVPLFAAVTTLSLVSLSHAQSPAPPGPKTATAASPIAAKGTKITPAASPVAASPTTAASPVAAATAPPAVVVVTQPAAPSEPAAPPSNNWAAGLIGLVILGVGGYFGLRYAQKKGATVADSLQKLGVEMPQDGANGPATISHLKPPPPSAAVLPPLPSLSNLPEAASMSSGLGTAVSSAPTQKAGIGSFIGTLGPVEGKQITVPADAPLTMGRDSDNTLPMPDDTTVSRRHARIQAVPDGKNEFQIVDEGSSNGTYVNGQRLTAGQARKLVVGDEIQIGASRLRFEG